MGNAHNGEAGRLCMNMFSSNKRNQMFFNFPKYARGSDKTREMESHGDVLC